MLHRCNDTKHKFFSHYGGRGINVCNRWIKYENFVEDMLPIWKQGLSIERIDNDNGYSPENCRWANPTEQANNRRNSTQIIYNGETRTLAQWIKKLGLKSSTIRQRYYVYHWNIDKCFSGR